ncbi:MAG: biopolymer transporter ExbD [Bacteroidia bacterium]|nr:biopolymer transporter ExbD [Bacteroidia bacterium]
MNLRRRHKEEAEVSTESLNDIMFFLLLFFLIVSTLVSPSVIKLTLPSTRKGTSLENKPKIVVEAGKDGHFAVNGVECPFTVLESAIATEVNKTGEKKVVLRIDNSLTVQDMVDVLQIGDKLGVKMVLKTKSPTVK